MQIEKTADAVFEAVKSYIEKRLKNLPVPRDGKDGTNGMTGLKGVDGSPGADGKPGADGERGPQGEKGMDGATGEKGIDGAPGERGEQGPAGARGEKGDPGERGDPGADGKDGSPGEKGIDGRDGIDGAKGMDGSQGAAGDQGLPGERGEKGAPGERGEPGAQGLSGAEGTPGLKGMDGEPGRDGRDGPPGRDAAQIDILPSINEERSYGRGTWASHKGGLWQATRATDGMDGWKCIVEGVVGLSFTQSPDDPRHFVIDASLSSGKCATAAFIVPSLVYKGIFREGERYEPGDTVTWAGSMFHCNESTTAKPETDKSWALATKRGRDGKDGRNGIDLTKPVKL